MPLPSSSFKSVTALQTDSVVSRTTTLGPFTISQATSGGLWLAYIDVRFGVPTAAINEDVLLLDILSNTIMEFHENMGIAPMPPTIIHFIFPFPGIFLGAVSGGQMQYSIQNPATTSGPRYSVNLGAYLI